MNGARCDYLVVTELPYKVSMTFKSAPENKAKLQPMFKRLGSDECLKRLGVKSVKGKEVCVMLPESLACFGEGRYELCVHDNCCNVCDCVEIWFEADCEIVSVEGESCERC
jgi:hypothetical protein